MHGYGPQHLNIFQAEGKPFAVALPDRDLDAVARALLQKHQVEDERKGHGGEPLASESAIK